MTPWQLCFPFPYSFYGQSFTSVTLGANGNLQFIGSNPQFLNSCLPDTNFSGAIFPLWDDLRTDATGSGIFISTNGTAPNRIFNIEWRASYYETDQNLNFELRLYEGQLRFDMIYGALNGTGDSATVGVQSGPGGGFSSFECNSGGLSNGLQLTFQQFCTDGGGPCVATIANFAASPTNGAAPMKVIFTNLSTGAADYSWNFGDGNISTSFSPTNTYTNAGSYSVSLTAVGSGGTNILILTNYVTGPIHRRQRWPTLSPGRPMAWFLLPCGSPNLSSGAIEYNWGFRGWECQHELQPDEYLHQCGNYSVSLTAVGAGGTNTLTLTNYVAVTNPPPPAVANFVAGPTNGVMPLTVWFTNLSTGATAYSGISGMGISASASARRTLTPIQELLCKPRGRRSWWNEHFDSYQLCHGDQSSTPSGGELYLRADQWRNASQRLVHQLEFRSD